MWRSRSPRRESRCSCSAGWGDGLEDLGLAGGKRDVARLQGAAVKGHRSARGGEIANAVNAARSVLPSPAGRGDADAVAPSALLAPDAGQKELRSVWLVGDEHRLGRDRLVGDEVVAGPGGAVAPGEAHGGQAVDPVAAAHVGRQRCVVGACREIDLVCQIVPGRDRVAARAPPSCRSRRPGGTPGRRSPARWRRRRSR